MAVQKIPWLCWLGWHSWRVLHSYRSYVAGADRRPLYLRTLRCTRCPAEKSELSP